MILNLSQLPVDQTIFLAKFAAYTQAMRDHALTVGVPAPFPEYDVFRIAWERGEGIAVHDDTPPPPPTPPALTPAQIAANNLASKKALAMSALDEQRLAAALIDPLAPQAVKDYAAAKGG